MGLLAENVITVQCIVKVLIRARSRSRFLVAWSWYLPRLSHSGETVTHSPKVSTAASTWFSLYGAWHSIGLQWCFFVFFSSWGKGLGLLEGLRIPDSPDSLFPSIPGYCMQIEDASVTAKHRGKIWSFMCKTDTEVMEAWIIHPLHTHTTLADQAS